jgi:MFS family permease
MGLLGAAYNVGFIFGPGLGGLLARPDIGPAGFRPPLLVGSALAAASALLILLVVRKSRVHAPRQAAQQSQWSAAGAAFRHPVVGPLMALTFVLGLAFNGFESTFGFWATHRYRWSTAAIGYCFTAAAIASTLGQALLTGTLSRRFGQTPMLAAGIAVTAVGLVAQPFSPSGGATVLFMAVMSLGQAFAYPNTTALISRATDADRQGQTLGLNNAMDSFSRLIGPQAALALFAWSPDATFYVGAGVTAPTVLLALMAGRALRRPAAAR